MKYLFDKSRDEIYTSLNRIKELDEKYNLTIKFGEVLNSDNVIAESFRFVNSIHELEEDYDTLTKMTSIFSIDKSLDMNEDDVQDIREGIVINFESSSDKIRESTDNLKGMFPLYFVFNNSSALISKIIRAGTKADFSHVSISASGPNDLVSFATSYRNGKLGGLITEDMYELINVRRPLNLGVYAIMIDEKQLLDLAISIEYFKKRASNFRYSWKKLITYPFVPKKKLKEYDIDNELYCSEFVGWLLHTSKINTKLEGNKFINVAPSDYERQLSKSKSFPIYKGETKHFDIKRFLSFEERLGTDVKRRKEIFKHAKSIVDENDELLMKRVSSKMSISDLNLK